jgi:hypothetical protein
MSRRVWRRTYRRYFSGLRLVTNDQLASRTFMGSQMR